MRGMLRPFDRMSLRAMVGLQTLVGFSEDAIAIFGELLADDDVESEVLKLVDPREPPLASSANLAGSMEGVDRVPDRSEEHTSELQSLMRISYAVFCLKKKTIHYSVR